MINQIASQGVDAIQGAKKQFITTFVQHEGLAKVLNTFVDAQAQYTKSAIDAGIKAGAGTMELLTDRTPYVQMAEKFAAYFPSASTKKSK
jgi:hypothetical protein